MSLGGGGYGGGGLPFPKNVLQIWGGQITQSPVAVPALPKVLGDDGSGKHEYAIVAIGPRGDRTPPSPVVRTNGLARLQWDSVNGGDAYIVIRDGNEIAGPLRIEGAQKEWTDPDSN
jgi:hypothetical protein